MKKNIWVLCNRREDLIEAQRRINEGGGLRAFCMVSCEAVERALARLREREAYAGNQADDMPSLLIMDYESGQREAFKALELLRGQPAFEGIPLFFMTAVKSREIDEQCYALGATVVLEKPFAKAAIARIERAASQHEMTRSYEKLLQHQAAELAAAKEIRLLNEKLALRNNLLHQIFGKYFSDEVVNLILDHPEGAAIGGKKRRVTVMMADLRGFTALSERLSADTVVDIINYFLEQMTDVIMEHGGTVIEFIGDAILAVFGAPLKGAHAARDAVTAGIRMQNRMSEINRYNRSKGHPDIEMGIGIHTGEVFIGNIGSEKLMRYNVIGQTVNLCSRIESYSVGGQVLASMQTLEEIGDVVTTKNVFGISMKGIREQILIGEVSRIDGEDGCQLETGDEESFMQPKETIEVILCPVEGKMIADKAFFVRVETVSDKSICLRILEKQAADEEACADLQKYADVELITEDEKENAYAKVMERDGDMLKLHFTFLSEHFLPCCGYKRKD